MTAPVKPVGLSIGTTTLAAVSGDRCLTRPPVTHRAGMPITDFVDRVGDPVGIVAPDGTLHPAAALLADACVDLARAVTAGRPQPPRMVVAHPAHWAPAAVDALRRALRRSCWTDVDLMPDYAAALGALQAGPGLPRNGVIVVCDVGGSATTLTAVDADGFGARGPSVRHADLSGDLLDRAVLSHVMGQAAARSGPTATGAGTEAIGPLLSLRGQCRAAKERLSAVTVTSLPVELPGFRGDFRLTRGELDEILGVPLAGLVTALQAMLARNGIASSELSAVVSVGGGAAIPAVTAALSEALRVPVITTTQPMLAAAFGAAARAERRDGAPAPEPATAALAEPRPAASRALAWSAAADVPALTPADRDETPPVRSAPAPRPQLEFARTPAPVAATAPWYRRTAFTAAAALLLIAGAAGATAMALRADPAAAPETPAPGTTGIGQPPTGAPVTADPPPRRTVVAIAPPETRVAPSPAPQQVPQQLPAPTAPLAPVAETSTTTVVSTEPPPPAPPPAPPPVIETVTAEAAPAPPPLPPALISAIPTIPPIPLPPIPGLPTVIEIPQG